MNKITKLAVFFSMAIVCSCSDYPPPFNPSWVLFSEYVEADSNINIYNQHRYANDVDDPSFVIGRIRRTSYLIEDVPYLYGEGKRYDAIRRFYTDKINHLPSSGYGDYYYTITITGKPKITSDVSLFGELPGTDLADRFYIPDSRFNYYSMILEGQDYEVICPEKSVKPSNIEKAFFLGRVFTETEIALIGKPITDISSAELLIEVPVEDTFYLDAFDYDGNFDESKVTKRTRTLTGVITVTF